MNDEFLMRVDEELPSDERTAVKVIETKVVSDEYRAKLESVIEKLESVSAINNADVLRDMKDILSGLLDSITAINSKYSFLSEMMLKIDEKSSGEKVDKFAVGMADILADIQTSLSELKEKFGTDPLLADSVLKLEEKLNEISVINAELGEKVEGLSAEYREALDSAEEKLGDISVSNASLLEKVSEHHEALGNIEEKLGDISVSNAAVLEKIEYLSELGERVDALSDRVEEKMGEMSSNVSGLGEKISDIHGISQAVESLKSSVTGLESRYNVAADMMLKLDEKLGDSSVEIMEVVDKIEEKAGALGEALAALEEKLNNVSVANSELLGGISDSIRNMESRHDAISDTLTKFDERLMEMSSSGTDALARIDEKLDEVRPSDGTALDAMDGKIGGIYSVVESLNDKINDALIQGKELSDKLDQTDDEAIAGVIKDEMSSLERKLSGSMDSMSNDMLDKMDKRLQLASEETHRVRRELEEVESRLKKQAEEVLAAISALKPAAAKPRQKRKAKKPARRRARRARRVARRAPRVDNETLDTLIVNTLNAASMNIAQLRNTTKIGEKKLRERLDVLMARGVVVREKRGRYIFYVSQAEQPMPTG